MRYLRCIALLLILSATGALADSYTPGTYNIVVNQGEDYRKTVYLQNCSDSPPPQIPTQCRNRTPVNLSGYRFRSLARISPTSGAILGNFSTAVNASGGTVQLVMGKDVTAAIGGKAGYWDLQVIEPDGSLTYLLKGRFSVAPTTTR